MASGSEAKTSTESDYEDAAHHMADLAMDLDDQVKAKDAEIEELKAKIVRLTDALAGADRMADFWQKSYQQLAAAHPVTFEG